MKTKGQYVGLARFLAATALLTLCNGCLAVGMSTWQHSIVFDEFALDSSTEDVMLVVEQVGKSLGYRVNARVKAEDFTLLDFESRSPFIIGITTRYTRGARLWVTHKPLEQKLHFEIRLSGNFGTGDEGDAQKALQTFKDKLQDSLRAQKKPST